MRLPGGLNAIVHSSNRLDSLVVAKRRNSLHEAKCGIQLKIGDRWILVWDCVSRVSQFHHLRAICVQLKVDVGLSERSARSLAACNRPLVGIVPTRLRRNLRNSHVWCLCRQLCQRSDTGSEPCPVRARSRHSQDWAA